MCLHERTIDTNSIEKINKDACPAASLLADQAFVFASRPSKTLATLVLMLKGYFL